MSPLRRTGWRGELLLHSGFAVFDGPPPERKEMAVHVIRVILDPTAPQGPRYGGVQLPPLSSPFVIAPGVPTLPPAGAASTPIWLIDPTTALGQCVPLDRTTPVLLPQLDIARSRALCREAFASGDLGPVVAEACRVFGFTGTVGAALRRVSSEPRIEALLNRIDDERELVSLRTWARRMLMSYSHLSRLFARHVGIGYPAYLRQQRLYRAIHALEHAASLTDSAHSVGFADLAHLSRTAKALLSVRLVEAISGVRVAAGHVDADHRG
jgi:AraC-like DNA-binding protein